MTRHIKPSIDVRLELLNKSPGLIASRLMDMARALLRGVPDEVKRAEDSFSALVGQTMALASMVGAKRALMSLDAAASASERPPVGFSARAFSAQRFSPDAFAATPIFPSTAFVEAFESFLEREPRLARTAEGIRRVYAEGGFAVKKIAEKAKVQLLRKIQEKIAEMGAAGVTSAEARKVLPEMLGSTEAYAETVYRTNLARAFTDGEKRQMESPEAQAIAPAFEYEPVGDVDTRPNHQAASGLVAPVGHAVWDRYAPPNGWNCRCDLRIVTRFELADRGLLDRAGRPKVHYPPTFAQAGPDPGFVK